MAAFAGKWQLCSSEKFDEYMLAIGVAPDMVEKAKSALGPESKLTLEFGQNGDQWTLKTITPLGEKQVQFKLGSEFETTTLDGRTVKVVMSMEGDNLVETQTGSGFQSRNTRTIKGGEMVAYKNLGQMSINKPLTLNAPHVISLKSLCGGGVTAVRKYKRV